MDTNLILYIGIAFLVSIVVTYLIANIIANRKIKNHKSLSDAVDAKEIELEAAINQLKEIKANHEHVYSETIVLQELKNNADSIKSDLDNDTLALEETRKELTNSSENLIREKQHDR